MVRLSKQARRRSVNYKRPKISGEKTAQQQQNTFKAHANAISGTSAQGAFIPKIA